MKFPFALLVLAALLVSCTKQNESIQTQDNLPGSFAPKQIRYMAPFDILRTLKEIYPNAVANVNQNCKFIGDEIRGIVGDSSAATGSPIFHEPNAGFIRWYVACVKEYAERFQNLNTATAFGPHLMALVAKNPSLPYTEFSKIALEDQLLIIEDHISRLIGPSEVIEDFGYFKNSRELAQHILDSLQDQNALTNKVLVDIDIAIAIRDEFLSY